MYKHRYRDSPIELAEGLLDVVLAIICGAALVVGVTLLARGTSLQQLLFIDLGAIPWGEIWEILEGLGLTAGATRGAIWIWRKFGGDKYAVAIWSVLDVAAPRGLPKDEIEYRVRKVVKEKRDDKFRKKFDKAWMKLRKSGDIKSVDDEKSGAIYKLKIDD